MTGVLPLVALAALATAITVALERGGRAGYGWVTGSEFVLVGIGVGPLGLDVLNSELLGSIEPAVLLAVAWLGLRFGLRFRPAGLRPLSWRMRLAVVVEPLVSLLVMRALLEPVVRWGGVGLAPGTAWALAAVGSATTKSATAWARAQLGAHGGLTDALDTISTLDDFVLVGAAAFLAPKLHPVASRLPPHAWAALAATLGLGLLLALLVALLLGRSRFHPDMGWVALFGACALGTGLASSLGLAPIAVMALAGAGVGLFSPWADALEELTRSTERPAVLVLLLLGGASITGVGATLIAGAAAALLRVPAKLLGGLGASGILPREASARGMGAGLLGAGGVAFAVAVAMAHQLPAALGEPVMDGAVCMALLGDFLGSPLLRRLLDRAHQLPPPHVDAREPAP